MQNRCEKVQLIKHGDEKGQLVVVEGSKDVPFEIKRVFYIFGTQDNTSRGMHANRTSEFFFVNVCGSSKIEVDNGISTITYVLDTPHVGLYIPKMYWKRMFDFSKDSILLVLSSHIYDPNEYIYDYKEFLNNIRKV